MDDGVLELASHLLHLADVDILDRIAEIVHLHGTARIVAHRHLAEGGEELFLVFRLAVDGLERIVVKARGRVALGGIERGPPIVALLVGRGELLVGRGVEHGTVDERGHHAHRLLAHVLEDVLVREGSHADERNLPLQAEVAPGLDEARRETPGVAGVDTVDVFPQRGQVGRVVLDVQGRPDPLHHLAP